LSTKLNKIRYHQLLTKEKEKNFQEGNFFLLPKVLTLKWPGLILTLLYGQRKLVCPNLPGGCHTQTLTKTAALIENFMKVESKWHKYCFLVD
jgi:hypothetical protein